MDLDLPAPKKLSCRQKWGIAAFLVAVFGLLGYLYLRDEPPHDDSDLALPVSTVSEEENGLRFFAGFSVERLEKDEDFERLEESMIDHYPEPWDADFAAELIARYSPLLDALEAAAECPLLPEKRADPSDLSLRYALQLAEARERIALESGDFKTAARSAVQRFRISRVALESYSDDWCWGGFSENTSAIAVLAEIASKAPVESFRREGQQFIRQQPDFQDIERAWLLTGYDAFKGDISWLKEKLDVHEVLLAFKPNRTTRLYAELTRAQLAQIGRPLEKRTPSLPMYRSELAIYLSANAEGIRVLFNYGFPDYSRLQIARLSAEYDTLAVLIALRLYHADKGHLPETLDVLVPDYLPSVPIDPFDGKPMRYDRETAKVWVVGKDLIDDGGTDSEETEFHLMPDPLRKLDPSVWQTSTDGR